MSYRYLEHTADALFEAWGETLEELFSAAADALLNVMVEDVATIEPKEEVSIRVEHPELDLLLYNFLLELVFFKDARQLLLRVPTVAIAESGSAYCLAAVARGERIDRSRHPLLTDVKAVTLHGFTLEKTATGWRASVLLDV
jgi:SHS2 domain-containing protein